MPHINSEKQLYPYDGWEIIEDEFKIENNLQNEAIFALGNGYLGMRGNFEEGCKGPAGASIEGTYINGFYEAETIRYGEIAFGYPEKSQTMLNITNSRVIKLYLEDEEFDMFTGEFLKYRRALSLKDGILRRAMVWRSPKGREISIETERIVSLTNRHLAGIKYEVTPLNFSGQVRLVSSLDGNVTNLTAGKDPRVGTGFEGRVLDVIKAASREAGGILVQKTRNTGFTLACAMENRLDTKGQWNVDNTETELLVGTIFNICANKGQKITLNKFISYVTSREFNEDNLLQAAGDIVKRACEQGFDRIKHDQRKFLRGFWYRSDICIEGDLALRQGIRFNIFHLLQSAGKDGRTNIPAKGLTGEGYEGHYFWDTEIFMFPFFLFNHPETSRKLLEYRYNILDKARDRARQMSHKRGALFPWRTINGDECSAYYPAGTAQYHINADIAHAVKRYVEATEDRDFMVSCGAEILFETARLWADLGSFIEAKGNRFCINGVTGPDEYTAIVNNNCYTNLMAAENLRYAYETAVWMKENRSEEYIRLARKIGLEEPEIGFWKKASDKIYVPYDDELGLYPQDDSFFEKAVWDFNNTPRGNYPLLLHYHPLVIYRHQVCKQADLVLALFLLGSRFTEDEKRRNYDYYEKVTTHDSSLSACIFSVMASEVGYRDKAYQYFLNTARADLDDQHGNTGYGLHAAGMAGAWMCIINGFAGMRMYEGVLRFNPYLPHGWKGYRFRITFKGRLMEVSIDGQGTTYRLLEGTPMELFHRQKEILIRKDLECIMNN